MGILNLQSGRQKAVQVLGLKELQKNVNTLISRSAGREAEAITLKAGRVVLDRIYSAAVSAKVPSKVLNDLFIYSKRRDGEQGQSISVLVGLRKHGVRLPSAGYVTWNASSQVGAFNKTPRLRKKGATLKIQGQKIGENLGTMWELGTTKMSAKPWFRPGVNQARPVAYQVMADGYNGILDTYR